MRYTDEEISEYIRKLKEEGYDPVELQYAKEILKGFRDSLEEEEETEE